MLKCDININMLLDVTGWRDHDCEVCNKNLLYYTLVCNKTFKVQSGDWICTIWLAQGHLISNNWALLRVRTALINTGVLTCHFWIFQRCQAPRHHHKLLCSGYCPLCMCYEDSLADPQNFLALQSSNHGYTCRLIIITATMHIRHQLT